MRLAMAQVNKSDNGYIVRYPEAIERDQLVPSQISGLDDAQIDMMIAVNSAALDEDDETWNEGAYERRVERVRERIQKVRERAAHCTRKMWVIEMREWHMPSFDGLFKALEEADKAHDRLVELVRQGTQFAGPLQPQLFIGSPYGSMPG